MWEAAVNCCQQAEQKGYDRLKAKQKALWGKRYEKLGIEIEGDEEAEKAVLYSAYLLYSSAPEHTDRVAIPARGLSGQEMCIRDRDWSGYSGIWRVRNRENGSWNSQKGK